MKNEPEKSVASRQYWEAYAVHYTVKDLHQALDLYKGIVAAHPDTEEANYSRSQIQNIVNSVVPKQELYDAQVEMARVHTEHKGPPDAIPVSS